MCRLTRGQRKTGIDIMSALSVLRLLVESAWLMPTACGNWIRLWSDIFTDLMVTSVEIVKWNFRVGDLKSEPPPVGHCRFKWVLAFSNVLASPYFEIRTRFIKLFHDLFNTFFSHIYTTLHTYVSAHAYTLKKKFNILTMLLNVKKPLKT